MATTLKHDLGLALLRISGSALLLTHGIPKLQKLLHGDFQFADPLGIGPTPSLFLMVIAEFLCPVLIILGFKTRWAAVPPAIGMLTAALVHHSADSFDVKEKAVLYLAIFLSIIFMGPGRYSIDRR